MTTLNCIGPVYFISKSRLFTRSSLIWSLASEDIKQKEIKVSASTTQTWPAMNETDDVLLEVRSVHALWGNTNLRTCFDGRTRSD